MMEIRKSMRRDGERKHYSDEGIEEDEIDGKRSYDVSEKLKDPKFEIENYVKQIKGEDFTIEYLQQNGFQTPLIIKDKSGLGLRVPSQNFNVDDVRRLVGSYRLLDVMDVETQKDLVMTMKDWCRYFKNPVRQKLLNVISLEFSKTKLEDYVDMPRLVKDIDWVNSVWPIHLLEAQNVATNNLSEMKYPKVRKYVLMSVAGCYTDFHIDFGGTSVWYHILHGAKVFWLIPPTENNYKLYLNWTLSANQGDVFLGDLSQGCCKVYLEAGDTFLLPTGWIHAVFTPTESLVFGGNFLHSFSIAQQLRVNEMEDLTHVKLKFRYPFYNEIHWFVLEKYVRILSGKSFLSIPQEYIDKDSVFQKNVGEIEYIHLTKWEIESIKALINFLTTRPFNKQNIPTLITNPEELIVEAQNQLSIHYGDGPLEAVNGKHVLTRPDSCFKHFNTYSESGFEDDDASLSYKSSVFSDRIKNYYKPSERGSTGRGGRIKNQPNPNPHLIFIPKDKLNNSMYCNILRKRRIRCMKCEACLREDCRECQMCRGMTKFGGPGTLKKPCVSRQCMMPLLPKSTVCFICYNREPPASSIVIDEVFNPNNLNECIYCRVICHPDCLYNYNINNQLQCNEDNPSQDIADQDNCVAQNFSLPPNNINIKSLVTEVPTQLKIETHAILENGNNDESIDIVLNPESSVNVDGVLINPDICLSGIISQNNKVNGNLDHVVEQSNVQSTETPENQIMEQLIDTERIKNSNYLEKGIINEDTACWWECPNCLKLLSKFGPKTLTCTINGLTKRLQMVSTALQVLLPQAQPLADQDESLMKRVFQRESTPPTADRDLVIKIEEFGTDLTDSGEFVTPETKSLNISLINGAQVHAINNHGNLNNDILENSKNKLPFIKVEQHSSFASSTFSNHKIDNIVHSRKRGRKPKPKIDSAFVTCFDDEDTMEEKRKIPSNSHSLSSPASKKKCVNFNWEIGLKSEPKVEIKKEYECLTPEENVSGLLDNNANHSKIIIRRKSNGFCESIDSSDIGSNTNSTPLSFTHFSHFLNNTSSTFIKNVQSAMEQFTSQITNNCPLPHKDILVEASTQTEEPKDQQYINNGRVISDKVISRPSKRNNSSLLRKDFAQENIYQNSPWYLIKSIWGKVFRYLDLKDAISCEQCCKAWRSWAHDIKLEMEIVITKEDKSIINLLELKKPLKIVIKDVTISQIYFHDLIFVLPGLKSLTLANISFSNSALPSTYSGLRNLIWNLVELRIFNCLELDNGFLFILLTNRNETNMNILIREKHALSCAPALQILRIENCPKITSHFMNKFLKLLYPPIPKFTLL